MTRHNGNVSGARTRPGVVVYQAGQRETHVIVAGNMFRWQDKAPYTRSGHSILGALEYDEKTGEVKCHTCGCWRKSIGHHIALCRSGGSSSHTTVREYKLRHGFRMASGLHTPAVRETYQKRKNATVISSTNQPLGAHSPEARRAHSRTSALRREVGISSDSENYNLTVRCKAQRLKELHAYARKLRRCPKYKELRAYVNPYGIKSFEPTALQRLFGVPTRMVLVQAGLQPPERGQRL